MNSEVANSEIRTRIQEFLRNRGTPQRDVGPIPDSMVEFPDGSEYKVEIVPRSMEEYERIPELMDQYGVQINRLTDVTGTTFESDERIREKCRICSDYEIELLMAPGLGEHDGDISHQQALGAMQSGKIRGSEQIVNTIAEVYRAINLGVRGFVIYDEGLLKICCELREEGEIPTDTTFKMSSIFSISNPSTIQFWVESLELASHDSVNPIRDLTLPMISSLREATDQPLDVHAFWHTSIARTMETPEMARIGSPIYFKNAWNGPEVSVHDRFIQTVRLIETIEQHQPEIHQAEPVSEGWGLPVIEESA